MAITYKTSNRIQTNNGTTTVPTGDYTENSERVIEDTLAGSASDVEYDISFVAARAKVIVISSDTEDITIKTNSTGSPGDTLTIQAGKAMAWIKDSGLTNPFSTDVTKFFISNGGGEDTEIAIRVLYDATP